MSPESTGKDSERRQATIVFADISGFTSMSEKMDPEEVATIMNSCFEKLEAVVTSHGGHVDKYIGDCIMALFGVPKALESAPRQAVNAAIEMRNELDALVAKENLTVPLGLHVGVNSGLVLAGEVGGETKREFTVMGDAVNLASRLKDVSPTGSIYVGAETYRYTEDDFEYRKLAPQKLKGKEFPVAVYEILSQKEQVHRLKPARADQMISSDIVGREGELQQLRECIANVIKGRGAIVNLIGEAGIGKSRLMAEVTRLEEITAVTLLEGRSLAVGQSLSFHPFIDLLRQWAGITDEEGEQQLLPKLEASITDLFAEEAGEIFPFTATLMGMRVTGAHAERIAGIEGEALEKMILKSTRELLQKMAAAKPLVLVFEDLHWADQSSVKLLESLLRLATTSPVLFIHAFRPDQERTSRQILKVTRESHASHLVEISFRRLDTKECDILIQNLLKIEDLPYPTRALIARKAEGNPFYIEEVIRALVDEGAVEYRQGQFRVTAKIDSVVIPGTIQEVIMTRVDRLPEQARRLLQTASVIGRSFPYRILADLQQDARQLEWALSTLKRSQLLEERQASGELEYTFKHALAQETIYGSILQKTRKALHVKVAQSIESLFAERLPDFYGMLAYHFSRAENLEKAEEYLLKAGDDAARSAAASEALNYFREASRLFFLIHGDGGDPNRKAQLEKNIGLALLNTGALNESIEHFGTALGYLGEQIPKSAVGLGLRFGADITVLLYHLYAPAVLRRPTRERANDREILQILYNRARAQVTTDPKRYFIDTIGALRHLGQTDTSVIDQACGMYAGGAALFAYSGLPFGTGKRFLDVAKQYIREGNIKDRLVYQSYQFVHEYFKGNWSEDAAIEEESVDQLLRHGQIFEVFAYLCLNAERKAYRGEFAEARRQIDKLRELSESYGFDLAKTGEHSMTAILLTEERRFASALGALDLYYQNAHEEGFKLFELGARAKVQTLMGDSAAAEHTLAKADAQVKRLGQVFSVYHYSVFAASRFLHDVSAVEAACRGGSERANLQALSKRARRSGRRAVGIAAKIAAMRPEAYRLAGRLYWLLGKEKQSLAWWTKSIDAAESLGARPELARAYMEVGDRISERDRSRTLNGIDAATYLDMAKRLLEELKIVPDLERLGLIEDRRTGTD